MTFDEYGEKAIGTLLEGHAYGDMTPALLSQILGLVGESGELAEKVKKIIRDQGGKLDNEMRVELLKELGDVLWYVNSVSRLLDSDIAEVANKNLEKIQSRKTRGVQRGSGDNR